ncbi:MAG: hypothetical protein JRH01_18715 [Deltaproteobacteria bacterium]|nr:hypothetical protein [Deltaproteobacteria bacterium]
MDERLAAALPFVAWSRVWSPLASEALREEAWNELSLPGRFAETESAFLDAFMIGLGGPRVPLLLHAALGKDGGAVREDWMRVIQHLELRWKEQTLPPDHLGVACDVVARAIEHEEHVLIRELRARYLDPWCEIARERLAGRDDDLARLPERFSADLVAAAEFAEG